MQSTSKALLPGPRQPEIPSAELIVRVARDFGVSPIKQMTHMLARIGGNRSMMYSEYYDFGLYDSKLSAKDRRAFVGIAVNRKLNETLTPLDAGDLLDLIQTKSRFGQYMLEKGHSVAATQAIFAPEGEFDGLPVLRSAQEIAVFLRAKGTRYPIFGKPMGGTQSVGSAWIAEYVADSDSIVLGNGKSFSIDAFAHEVSEDFADGYMFQDAIKQHADMAAMTGTALGSLRVLTVNDGTGPQVFYTLWKIPSPDAMSDNFWQAGSMLCKVDETSGITTTCRRGKGPDAEDVSHHPVSGVKTVGFKVPHFDAVKELATRAHAEFPTMGVIGWDMGVSPDGPVIIEANCNPYHTLYQIATGEGACNPRHQEVFKRVRAYQKANRKGATA